MCREFASTCQGFKMMIVGTCGGCEMSPLCGWTDICPKISDQNSFWDDEIK